MISKGLQPNVVTCSAVIDALSKQGTIRGRGTPASHGFKGLEPNIVTCISLLDGFCKEQQLDKAWKMLQYLSFKGHEPNVVIYGVLSWMHYAKMEKMKRQWSC
jgi:pentatricopeptide repeat protein